MSSVASRPKNSGTSPPTPAPTLPPLENGDHLDQPTFHARYQQMPPEFHAELIQGVVYVASPLKKPHSRGHNQVLRWLFAYEDATPFTEVGNNLSVLLGRKSEPQPDSFLFVVPEAQGQTRERDEYVVGPPELIAEISASTVSIDLHAKKEDYEKAGVQEYIVVAVSDQHVYWFVRRQNRFEELSPGPDGILRSEVFPGLWLDPLALLHRDWRRVYQVLQTGLASAEHAAFVTRLEQAATRSV